MRLEVEYCLKVVDSSLTSVKYGLTSSTFVVSEYGAANPGLYPNKTYNAQI